MERNLLHEDFSSRMADLLVYMKTYKIRNDPQYVRKDKEPTLEETRQQLVDQFMKLQRIELGGDADNHAYIKHRVIQENKKEICVQEAVVRLPSVPLSPILPSRMVLAQVMPAFDRNKEVPIAELISFYLQVLDRLPPQQARLDLAEQLRRVIGDHSHITVQDLEGLHDIYVKRSTWLKRWLIDSLPLEMRPQTTPAS